jgi:hypothetical protein
MSKRTVGIAVVALMLLIGGAIWAIHGYRANAHITQLMQVPDKIIAGEPVQREQVEQFGKAINQPSELSSAQREKLMGHMMEFALRQMQKQVDEYFALPPEKRNDYLDKQLLDQEKARKEMETHQKDGKSTVLAGPPPGSGHGGPSASPDGLSQRRNQMLDSTSPELRAKITAFMSDLQKRRIALGLPAGGPGIMTMQGPGFKATISVGPGP